MVPSPLLGTIFHIFLLLFNRLKTRNSLLFQLVRRMVRRIEIIQNTFPD